MTVELECEECGDVFERPPSKAERARFCSTDCRDAAQSQRVEIECEECGETFERIPSKAEGARFCSTDCRHAAGVAGRPRERVEIECEECGETFECIPSRAEGARFCSRECNLSQNRPNRTPTEDLIDELQAAAMALGRPPTIREMNAYGEYSGRTYNHRFGSWSEALEAAGFDIDWDERQRGVDKSVIYEIKEGHDE